MSLFANVSLQKRTYKTQLVALYELKSLNEPYKFPDKY